MEKPVIIFGSKGIARAAYEIFKSNGIVVYGFLDDDKETHGNEIDDALVLGNTDDHGFLKLIGQKCEAFVAVDENSLRKDLVDLLMEQRKVMPMNALHQQIVKSESASFGYGNFVNANVFLGGEVKIGHHNIINSGAIIEHECEIQDFVQVGAGTIVGGGVKLENGAFVGAGVTIVSGVTIGENARIGAGSVVVSSIGANETVFGNPAQKIDK